MAIRLRKTYRFGPRWLHLAMHATQKGASSWSVKAGPWSWNSRTRAQRVDLPGPFHWQGKSRKRGGGGKTAPRGGGTDKPAEPRPPPEAKGPGRLHILAAAARARGHDVLDGRDARRGLTRDERWLARHEARWSRRHGRDRGVRLRSTTAGWDFSTVAAWNRHLLAQTPPARPAPPAPRRRRGTTSRPPRDPQQQKTTRLQTLLQAWEPQINQIRGKAIENMNLTGAVSAIKEFGDTAPTGVSDMRERLVALEQIGQALQEAMEGFATRARQDAHIAEEVVTELQPMEEAGETITQASTRTLAAFEDHYRDDIREAKAEQRVENEFLTR